MDRGAWQAALPRVAKGWTLLSDFHFTLPFGEGWASSFFFAFVIHSDKYFMIVYSSCLSNIWYFVHGPIIFTTSV